ncbi:MAG: carbohydrate ABC transporter permease [Candidatus Omnitrophica bacterium]|nr:carbohydrate ABC transporter permease [Candidatus Omnitrophota bacterium]
MKSKIYYKLKKIILNLLTHLFLLSVAISCIYPLIWTASSSLKTQETIFSDISLIPKEFYFKNYYFVIKEGNFGRYFLNSIFYTISVVFLIVIVSSLAAFAFSRLKFFAKNIIFFIFIGAMMIPLPGGFVPLYVLLNRLHLRNTPIGYILCMTNVGLSMSIFLLKIFFDTIPKELEEAARLDGCSKIKLWWNIFLPLSKPMLAVVIVFNALNVWNEYILALLIFDNKALMPLQRALVAFQGEFLTNYPLLMAALVITTLPIIITYFLVQRYIVRGVISGALFG